MNHTREDILQTALTLFAAEGYAAVSVSRIAGALGMTKAALYRHYESKRDIFDHILARMEQNDAEKARESDLPEERRETAPEAYDYRDPARMLAFSREMFRYWTEDPFASAFRRLLTLEQYGDPEMGKLHQQYLASGPLDYITDLLSGMGCANPRTLALRLYGAQFLGYAAYDGAENPAEITRQVDAALDALLPELEKEIEHGIHTQPEV